MEILNEAYSSYASAPVLVSVVIPCLNEEQTLGMVLDEVKATLDASDFSKRYEIVVADNGSTDASKIIATEAGAIVVNVQLRGYGAALQRGISESQGEIIVMMDADFTYPSRHIPLMVSRLIHESDIGMVVGTRLNGSIESGSMPILHRYLGTPVLTSLVNHSWSAHLSDVNSGMRVFWRRKFESWKVTSPGMEFASELIVNCLEKGDRIEEIPISFRKDKRTRRPHLNTWGDGMRHLLFLLSRTPRSFVKLGAMGALISVVLMVVSAIGPFQIGPLVLFGMHTLVLSVMLGFLGVQLLLQGLFLDMNHSHRSSFTDWLVGIAESYLFLLLAALVFSMIGVVVFLLVIWTQHHFHHLAFLRLSLVMAYVGVVLGSWAFGLLHLHIVKRVLDENSRRAQ